MENHKIKLPHKCPKSHLIIRCKIISPIISKRSYGKNGEHTHDYIYDENGNLIGRPMRELTDEERKENEDIL